VHLRKGRPTRVGKSRALGVILPVGGKTAEGAQKSPKLEGERSRKVPRRNTGKTHLKESIAMNAGRDARANRRRGAMPRKGKGQCRSEENSPV